MCSLTTVTSSLRCCMNLEQNRGLPRVAYAHQYAHVGRPDCVQQRALCARDALLRPGRFLIGGTVPRLSERSAYIAARTHARTAARSGIDSVINSGVDAIVAPHLTNSTGPAVAGYPNLSLPVGIRNNGRPAGMLMYSTFLHEPQLIGFGYALEQALNVRQQPQFLGSIIPIPNGGFCTGHQESWPTASAPRQNFLRSGGSCLSMRAE